MATLFIDLETRATIDLRKTNVYRYAEDPEFEILMAAYALDDEPVKVVIGEDAVREIPGLWDDSVLKVAHNAQFERVCISRLAGLPTGEYLDPEPWHDTQAVAAEHGYPQKLEVLATWLGGEKKDTAGTALINWFCKPDRKGEFRRPEDHPEKWRAFVEYCRQDVVTLRDVHRRLGDFPNEVERVIYFTDQAINDDGMKVDMDLARWAAAAVQDNSLEQEMEITEISGVENPNSRDQMMVWLNDNGARLRDFQAATVTKALEDDSLREDVRRVLELRQELALAAPKKYGAMLDAVCSDGRLRGGFKFFGAHTGRWAGRGVQPHNLPREELPKEADTDIALLDLEMGLGLNTSVLKALVRSLFVGPFSIVDYSAIEARVIAWLAGEEWALEAFRAGRDIYVETAERMGGLTRFQGKVAVLALGYGGGIGSLLVMGGGALVGAEGVTTKEKLSGHQRRDLTQFVRTWRDANPSIVQFWYDLEDAFVNGGEAGRITVEKDGKTRRLWLPSGRAVTYHRVARRFVQTEYGPKAEITFADPKWNNRAKTYGGSLAENVTQAVARDILAESLVRLHESGYRPVGHIHDEIIVESTDLEGVTRTMTKNPPWASGLPIGAEGFIARRYRKEPG